MGPRALDFDWTSIFVFFYNFKKIESRGDISTADDSVGQYRGLLAVYCRGIQALGLQQSQRAQPLQLKEIFEALDTWTCQYSEWRINDKMVDSEGYVLHVTTQFFRYVQIYHT